MVSAMGLGAVPMGQAITDAAQQTTTGGGAAFGSFVQDLVQQTGAAEQNAHSAVAGLLSGNGVELHDAMIATQKADMAFELALQMRNKAVGAYQQMMSTQF